MILRVSTMPLALFAVSNLAFISQPAAHAGESPLKACDLEKLRSGEVVFRENTDSRGKTDPKKTTATVLINAPVKRVWDYINECENAPNYTKGMVRADVLDEGKNYSVVEQEIKVSPMPGSFVYVIKNRLTEKFKRIDFERQSGDMKEIKGYWRMEESEAGDQTSLTYSLKLNTGFPVPKYLMRNSSRKSILDVLRSLRKEVVKSAE